jgi:DNA-binding SARP family transcriptional activator
MEAFPLSGEVLPGWYEDWLLVERERFRQIRLQALESLCDAYAVQGDHGRAIDAGLAAIELDPLRESAHRALMRAHLAQGNLAEVARTLEGFCTQVWDQLGIPPSTLMRTMADELRIPWRCGDAGGR